MKDGKPEGEAEFSVQHYDSPNGEAQKFVVNVEGGKYPERLIYAQTEINGNPNLPKPIPDVFQVTEVNK